MQTYDTYSAVSTALAPRLLRMTLAFAGFAAAGFLAACGPTLEKERGPARFPVEGLWIEAPDADVGTPTAVPGEEGRFLFLSSPGLEEHPYQFILIEYVRRDLALSGKRLFWVERSGAAATSATEVLLLQRRYRGSDWPNTSSDDFWAVGEFGPERLDRSFESTGALDRLRFQDDGRLLVGDEYRFQRILPPQTVDGVSAQVTELDLGVVLQTDEEGRRASALGFSPELAIEGAERQIIRDTGDGATVAGRARVSGLAGRLFGLERISGSIQAGDAVLPPDWRPQKPERRRLSREEVLRRLQRGEPVPREDLIRVLGEDQAP